jgi:hypothetical protein
MCAPLPEVCGDCRVIALTQGPEPTAPKPRSRGQAQAARKAAVPRFAMRADQADVTTRDQLAVIESWGIH